MHALLAPLVADLRPREGGWASASLVESIRQVVLGMVAVWQGLMVLAAWVSEGAAAWPLIAACAGLGIVAVLAISAVPAIPVWPMPIAMVYLALHAYLSSGDLDSVLVFAACWQINFAGCAFGLTLLRPFVVPVVLAVAASVSISILVALPQWGADLPVSIIVTQTSIILALRYGLPPLFALARRTDLEERRSALAVERAEIAQRANRQIAEEARVLHDTAVNTLGAIANGGAGTADPERVRIQCARDLAVLEELRSDRAAPARDGGPLGGALAASWIPVRRTGPSDAELAAAVAAEDPRAVAGFAGAVREALTNAAKHSGAPELEVAIAVDARALTVEVRDRGVGFDPGSVQMRGLAHSVQERADEHGFSARVESTPRRGARVVLVLPFGRPADTPETDAESAVRVERTIRGMLRRAALLWAVGVTTVSVILSVSNPVNHTIFAVILVAVMAGCCVWGRLVPEASHPRWTGVLLALAPSAIFVCAALNSEFGSAQAVHWQALAPTAPFVLLLSRRDLRRTIWPATTLWVVTVAAILLLGLPLSADAMAIVVLAAVVGLGFGLVWDRFQAAVDRLCTDTAASEQRTFRANLETRAARAAQRTYLRWMDTGLEPAMRVLRDIVEARRSAQQGETRADCATEELYLRQVIQIDPQLTHLGPSVFPAMRRAHDRGIALTLRLGDQDAADRETGQAIAQEMIAVIDDSSADDRVTATLFPVSEGLQLTLVRTPERVLTAAGDLPGAGGPVMVQRMFQARPSVDV